MEKRKIFYSFLFGLVVGNKGIHLVIHAGYLTIIAILLLKIFKVL